MKKRILAWGLAAMMALSMTACGSGSADPTTAPASAGPADTAAAGTAAAGGDVQFTLKLSVSAPATGTQADGYAKLAELVKERTGGAVEVQIYPGSQLADKVPSMEGLRDGSIEMTVAALTDIANFGDVWGTFSLPYLFEDTDQLIQVLNSDDVGAFVEEKLATIGMIPLMYMDIGSRSILNSKHAVNTPAEMCIRDRCGLTVADIDFKNEVVIIDHQLLKSKEQGYYIETPKTKSGARQVPLSKGTIQAFQRVMKKRPKAEPFVIDGRGNFRFVNQKGKPKVAIDYSMLFVRMVKKYNNYQREDMYKRQVVSL